MKTVDYIVIGQGLAGSAIALQLLKRKRSFVMIDDSASNHTSRIAAGLFNPITGKKMTGTWLAETLFPYLHTFYEEAERVTQSHFFHPMPLYRPFLSIEEQNEWMGKSVDPAFAPFIEKIFLNHYVSGVHDPFGGLLLKQCGFLDTTAYVKAVNQHVLSNHQFVLDEKVNQDEVHIDSETVTYRDYQARNLILCQGVHESRWFSWLPIRPLKGETLRIKANINAKLIVNRGVYVVPSSQINEWRVGGTYNFQDKTNQVTAQAKTELQDKLNALMTVPYEVIGQEWGVRPTTPDRRPLLGRHPEHKNLWVFNGFGTKGVSLSPYFSEVLINAIENGNRINKEVDIERYKLLY